jgi:hypothetical protein
LDEKQRSKIDRKVLIWRTFSGSLVSPEAVPPNPHPDPRNIVAQPGPQWSMNGIDRNQPGS